VLGLDSFPIPRISQGSTLGTQRLGFGHFGPGGGIWGGVP